MLATCCGFWSLERGAKIMSWTFCVLCSMMVISDVSDLLEALSITDDVHLYGDIMTLVHELIELVIIFACYVGLLFGLYRKHTGFILIALSADLAFSIFYYMTLCADYMFWKYSRIDSIASPDRINFVVFGIEAYFYMVMFSYLNELMRESRATNPTGSGIIIPYIGML